MSDANTCACSAAPKFVFACSGGADVGALSDQAARKLAADGAAKMYCLAGVGGRVSGILKSVEAASQVVAIDGCPLDCARKTLEQAGFSGFGHIRLTDLGYEKGQSPATPERIQAVAAAVVPLFA